MKASQAALETAFALLCRCCAPGDRSDEILATAAGVHWPTFIALARRHRVEALVFDRLKRSKATMPSDVSAVLKAAAFQITLKALLHAAETQALINAAEAAGTKPVVLKGTPLALLGHGALHLKHAKDIDIAVCTDELAAMRDVLTAAGYRCVRGDGVKDESWMHDERGCEVELHTALVDNPAWLCGLHPGTALAKQRVGNGRGMPTLAPADLHAYLSVHGAGHGWSRLKWLADLAALLARQTPETIATWHWHAVSMGAGRASAQALLMCHDLFYLPLPQALAQPLSAEFAVRWLVTDAVRAFTTRHALAELDTRVLATLRIHLAQVVMTQGLRTKCRLIREKFLGTDGSPLAIVRWLQRRALDRRQVTGGLRQTNVAGRAADW